jgi:hypothetical protein
MSEITVKKALGLIARASELTTQLQQQPNSDLSSPVAQDAAYTLHNITGQILKLVEDLDPNMDLKKTKLQPVGDYFEGNPVTPIVEERIGQLAQIASSKSERVYYELSYLDAKATVNIVVGLDLALEHLRAVEDYTEHDIKIARFYLGNVPYEAKIDVDTADDKTIVKWMKKELLKINLR